MVQFPVIVRDFSIHFSIIDNNYKDTEDVNNTSNQVDLLDIYRILH